MAMDGMQGVQTDIVAPAPIPGQGPAAPAPEEAASETLYIQNLNEKIKIPVLKSSLRGLFKSYGEVLDVVAHSNLRMRGQGFVSFESPEMAKKALKEVRGFPLYSKPMVRAYAMPYVLPACGRRGCRWVSCWVLTLCSCQQISFARTRSDAVVKKLDESSFDAHKQKRLDHKSMSYRFSLRCARSRLITCFV